jgi:hypothetical protein
VLLAAEDNVASGYARQLTGGGETASDGQTVVGLREYHDHDYQESRRTVVTEDPEVAAH